MSFATDFVNSLRKKAIAVYRLQHLNALVANGQELDRDLKDSEKELANINARLTELDGGAWSIPVDRVNDGKTPDQIKIEVREGLMRDQETLTKTVERIQKAVAENAEKMAKAEKGDKPYRASREMITKRVDALLEESTAGIEPDDYLPSDDTTPGQVA